MSKDAIVRARYVEAPAEFTGTGKKIFLAGGIFGTESWQPTAVELLAGEDVTILNPRRAVMVLDDDVTHAQQVAWEHRYLHEEPHRADAVLVWFAAGPTAGILQPIVWYELGRLVQRGARLAVGADRGYLRRRDVLIQMRLAAPGLTVHDTLRATCEAAQQLLRSRTVPVPSISAAPVP
ncbi:MAG TPA: nucleoside 2-deoxyribosyltransferase domain-containing protein [Actinocrinis sp.]|nr:nucleoside 2-deoxyribosyltransferase domain-containing protein [Actinocrinis sp.]